MTQVVKWDQANVSSLGVGVFNAPAGSTLLGAKLSCYTWFFFTSSPPVIQGAPPNTMLGVSWVPHGTVVPIVSPSNWVNGDWYIAGPGRLLAQERWTYTDMGATPNILYVQHTYSTEIELQAPDYQAGAFDLGLSINWQGQGFWPASQIWLSYQFEAWFD